MGMIENLKEYSESKVPDKVWPVDSPDIEKDPLYIRNGIEF